MNDITFTEFELDLLYDLLRDRVDCEMRGNWDAQTRLTLGAVEEDPHQYSQRRTKVDSTSYEKRGSARGLDVTWGTWGPASKVDPWHVLQSHGGYEARHETHQVQNLGRLPLKVIHHRLPLSFVFDSMDTSTPSKDTTKPQ